jgi:hypothetical protein
MVASGLWASWPLRTHLQGRGLLRQRTLTLIHPSAWKGNSANFHFTEFSEDEMRRPTPRCAVPLEGLQMFDGL